MIEAEHFPAMRLVLVVLVPLFFSFFATLSAQQQPQFYRFDLDQDRLSGPVDFSFLNQPLGPGDRVFVRDGRFYRHGPDGEPNTGDDQRVLFFGINLAFGANFPEERDAVRIAKRLRRFGINLVRLHHMDSSPDQTPANAGSILTRDPYPTLNPVAVARLRAFCDALKAEGIYVNLNLKVGYVFRPGIDPVPAISPFPNQSKPLHMIYPRMIELQTEFTRKVIEAVNLRDDPALAMVEINNETSLIWHWQNGSLDANLQGEYRQAFQRPWMEFLRARYASTSALSGAWGATEPDGDDFLPGRWNVENHTALPVSIETSEGVLRVNAPRAGSPIIVKQVGFSMAAGEGYVAEIEMRAPSLEAGQSRSVYWDIKQDVSPWRTVGARTVGVNSQWQSYRLPVTTAFAMERNGRFAISVEAVGVPLEVRNWRLRRQGRRGLSDNESLEDDRGVDLVAVGDNSTAGRVNDYLLFLAERDRYFLDEMYRAVRESTAWPVPVAGTQMGFGGLMNLDSHDGLDYQDNHFYLDHYNFPNVAWDGRDWRMRDSSGTGSGLSNYLNMAAARQAGRPYTVSEFNQNWPNTYAAELDPTLSVFARFQDWDSIMHFAYAHDRSWDINVPNGFNLNGDWTKAPAFGQSAWLYRSGAIQTGRNWVDVPVTLADRMRFTRERRSGAIATFLGDAMRFDPNVAFVRPVRLVKDAEGTLEEGARTGALTSPYRAETGEFTYDRTERQFLLHAARAAGVFGFLNQRPATAGALTVEPVEGSTSRGFVSLLLTALDEEPLEKSRRMLLTNPGYTLRTQPGAGGDGARPQAIVRYPGTTDWWTLEQELPAFAAKPSGNLNGGSRPVWMERVEVRVTLRVGKEASRVTLHPLNGRGERTEGAAIEAQRLEDGTYRVHLQAEGAVWTPWYEVVAGEG